MELLTSPRSDDLGALLERINVRSVVYCLSDLGAPWGFRVDSSATAKFHLVLDGQATLSLDDPGATRVTLAAGELVLLAHGSGHLMQDRGGSSARPLDHILAERPSDRAGRLTYGGRGPRTSLLCGGFALASGLPEDLLDLLGQLPPLLVLDAAGTGGGPWTRWLEPAFLLLREEGARDAPGATAIMAKIADVFLTEIVRRYLSGLDDMTAAVPPAAGRDPVVGTALTLLRSQPGAAWTVADLARKVDMSRTAFAARFRQLVGEPPMSYLTGWRLALAADLLREPDATVGAVARQVGYGSAFALSAAFKRVRGISPQEHRAAVTSTP